MKPSHLTETGQVQALFTQLMYFGLSTFYFKVEVLNINILRHSARIQPYD
jgi:hypothetical protein